MQFNKLTKIILLVASTFLCSSTVAYPTQNAAGSLSFLPPPELRVLREDLQIKEDLISAHYVIKNHSNLDLTQIISFSLPWQSFTSSNKVTKPTNLVIKVNNNIVKTKQTVQAIDTKGRDVTNILRSALIPLNPQQARQQLKNPKVKLQLENLAKHGLLEPSTKVPNWQTRIVYHWSQKFPAGKTVSITQQYVPEPTHTANLSAEILDYCKISATCDKDIGKTESLPSKQLQFSFAENFTWHAPVDKFSLTIHFKKDNMPIAYWPHKLNRSDKNTLVFTANNFVPLEDLTLVWMETPTSQDSSGPHSAATRPPSPQEKGGTLGT